jgi:aryl-alcohol dehydrogenase-like predicted oxidoreductase
MERTKIAGVEVSRIGLGTWAIGGSEWGAVSEQDAVRTILAAVEQGINLIDTAPIYGKGRAEELLGRAIREHGRRDDFYVATKCGLNWSSGGVVSDSQPERLRVELDDSLRRLGIETIDLLQVHWPDTVTPVAETAGVLAGFLQSGKVKALGVSNFSVSQMQEFEAIVPLASDQPPFNIFEREIETGDAPVLPWCAANGVAVLTYSSLCRSMLAGRLKAGTVFEEGDVRRVDPKFQEPRFSQYLKAVERIGALAKERFGKTVLEFAARWVLDRNGVSVALWGARKPEQLNDTKGVMGWRIDADTMDEVDVIIAACVTDPVGPEYLTPGVRQV